MAPERRSRSQGFACSFSLSLRLGQVAKSDSAPLESQRARDARVVQAREKSAPVSVPLHATDEKLLSSATRELQRQIRARMLLQRQRHLEGKGPSEAEAVFNSPRARLIDRYSLQLLQRCEQLRFQRQSRTSAQTPPQMMQRSGGSIEPEDPPSYAPSFSTASNLDQYLGVERPSDLESVISLKQPDETAISPREHEHSSLKIHLGDKHLIWANSVKTCSMESKQKVSEVLEYFEVLNLRDVQLDSGAPEPVDSSNPTKTWYVDGWHELLSETGEKPQSHLGSKDSQEQASREDDWEQEDQGVDGWVEV